MKVYINVNMEPSGSGGLGARATRLGSGSTISDTRYDDRWLLLDDDILLGLLLMLLLLTPAAGGGGLV